MSDARDERPPVSPAVRKAMAAFHGGRELLARVAALEARVEALRAMMKTDTTTASEEYGT